MESGNEGNKTEPTKLIELLDHQGESSPGQESGTPITIEADGGAELVPVPEPKLWIYTTNEDRNDFHVSWQEPIVSEELQTEHFTISSHGLDTQISDDPQGSEFKTIGQALADGNSLVVVKDGHGLNGDIRWGNTPTQQ